jgi:hypothetical protein
MLMSDGPFHLVRISLLVKPFALYCVRDPARPGCWVFAVGVRTADFLFLAGGTGRNRDAHW